MTRKPIPDEVQNTVLLKSRRRCCLCFWLSGIDDVQKGQIAHLDQDNENAAEENLVFLCFNHHDEYDGRTSQSKGLKVSEVRTWRDELYRELASRFRTLRKKSVVLAIESVGLTVDTSSGDIRDDFNLRFRLKNIAESPVHRPIISIALPANISARHEQYMQIPFGNRFKMPDFDLRGFHEIEQDFFEPNGRVASMTPLAPLEPILLPDHSIAFNGLALNFRDYPPGSALSLKSRVDAEDMEPVISDLNYEIPRELAEYLRSRNE